MAQLGEQRPRPLGLAHGQVSKSGRAEADAIIWASPESRAAVTSQSASASGPRLLAAVGENRCQRPARLDQVEGGPRCLGAHSQRLGQPNRLVPLAQLDE